MSDQITTPDIVSYWNNRVSESTDPGAATLLDWNMRMLEIDTVASWLEPHDTVLDAFCGNAVTTVELAQYCASITGVDLSERHVVRLRRGVQLHGHADEPEGHRALPDRTHLIPP